MDRLARIVLIGALALACSKKPSHDRVTYAVASPPRDFGAHPAIVELDAPPVTFAVSDVHGGYDRLVALLATHRILPTAPAKPEDAQWSAGTAVLVVTGDMIDKGPSALDVIDLLRALEPRALAAGGRVVVTLGNHEAEFLDDPENDKATKDDGVDAELRARGLTPVGVASGSDPRGAWLRDRPFGARVGAWFFAHAGDTHGRSIAALDRALAGALVAHDYDDPEIVGADSILESRGWYSADPATASRYADALGVKHIVFGHQPDALGPRGEIAVAFGGALFRIDCGMSPHVDDSHGKLLRVRREGAVEIAESLAPEGTVRELWRGP